MEKNSSDRKVLRSPRVRRSCTGDGSARAFRPFRQTVSVRSPFTAVRHATADRARCFSVFRFRVRFRCEFRRPFESAAASPQRNGRARGPLTQYVNKRISMVEVARRTLHGLHVARRLQTKCNIERRSSDRSIFARFSNPSRCVFWSPVN